ncbi:MAG: tRNA dihydrouridine synthase DusB [Flavobacteriia bacterium]|nr:tRNA dihydrouridine synthase DusB [Flavobacteriia bacterium]
MVKIRDIELPAFPLLLAPMEDVSDPPFRALCKKHGADVMYTEFISSEGLIRDAAKSVQKMDIFEYERPIGVQIFGSDEESMVKAAQIIEEVQPDLIDINYGCPVKKVACKGAGAALLQDIPKMVRLTKAVVNAVKIPVTVKTRLGWDDTTKNIYETAERLQDIGIEALTIHGRTRSQMYKGPADWTLIGEVKNNPRMRIPIFGNGDIDSPEKAMLFKKMYGVDGVMIGRAAIGYPWIFNEIKRYMCDQVQELPPTIAQRIAAVEEHLEFSIRWKGERVGIAEMKRHYTNYFKGLAYFKTYRTKLVLANEKEEVLDILSELKRDFKVQEALA